MKSRTKEKKKKSRKGLYITLISLVVLIIGGYVFRQQLAVAAFDLFLADTVEAQLTHSYVPQEGNKTPDPTVYRKEPFSVLLLGSDKRDYEKSRGRSDAVIYAVVRPKESRVLLVSIPRDTYVQIVGRDADKDGTDDYDKIAHAYAFGGENMSINTVEKFLNADVGYYATINFQGIKKVVDALGGISLPIDKDIVNKDPNHEKFTVKGGKPIYDGQEALYYVRYREDSDFNRTNRQQIFLNAFADKMLNLNQIAKIPELFQIMGDNFQTDMKPNFIIDLAKQVLTQEKPQVSSFTILSEGMRKNGIYYGRADEKDVQYAKELIKNWMDQSTPAGEVMIPDRQKIE